MKKLFVTITAEGPDAGKIAVETSGFNGKGCDAIHAAFAQMGTQTDHKKKPEYNQTNTAGNIIRNGR